MNKMLPLLLGLIFLQGTLVCGELEELVFPHEIRSTDGLLKSDLKFSVGHVENSLFKITTRLYENSIPGPTFRMRRGDKLMINLINELGEDNPYQLNMTDVHNTYSLPNTTNLHTHGLHVSGESPGDNVLIEVLPGYSQLYEIHIPEDHAGGTFWYHPHRHGSTFLHVSGGAAGMMIVEDEEGDVPEEIKTLQEVPIVIQHMKLLGTFSTQQIVDSTIPYDAVWKQELIGYSVGENDYDYNTMLVNGMLKPKRTMKLGEWQRFRFLLAGHSQYLKLTTDLQNCELNLFAKDGIYIFDTPRNISYIQLNPGSRADVAIRCNAIGNYTLHSIGSVPSTSAFGEWVGTIMTFSVVFPDPACPSFNYSNATSEIDIAMKERIQKAYLKKKVSQIFAKPKVDIDPTPCLSANKKHFSSLESFSTYRPHYIQDLTNIDESQIDTKFTVIASVSSNGAVLNGELFEPPPYHMHEMQVGKIQQWTLQGIAGHPIHLHINPFQIVGPENAGDNDYYKIGDFHDTLGNPSATLAIVRFQTDIFTGTMVFHCHILNHEDLGMMAIAKIVGEEGTRYTFPQP